MNEAQISSSEPPVTADHDDPKEALRASIERSEAELRDAVEELTTAVKNDITIGTYIAERPWAWLIGGFAFGLLLSGRSAHATY
jgi:hypothetical protein